MPTFTATLQTWLKPSVLPAKDIGLDKCIQCDRGKKIAVLKAETAPSDHLKLTLASKLSGTDTWYAYAPHWDTGTVFKKSATKILDYVAQPNDYTCQAACCAKVAGRSDVMRVRAELEELGNPGDPEIMAMWLAKQVKSYDFTSTASYNNIIGWLQDDFTLITHGWFSRSGHVICLVGYEPDGKAIGNQLIADDPYGRFNPKTFSYGSDINGDDVRYSGSLIYATCIGGNSYQDAAYLYKSGEFSPTFRNAWIHKIKN